jgi:serum/glucocorticoid-regulated kinase 2
MCLVQINSDIYLLFRASGEFNLAYLDIQKAYNRIDVNDFEYFSLLGHGSFGVVVHAKKKSTRKSYAVKIQTKVGMLDVYRGIEARVVSEKDAVVACRHPFIISMDYAFQTSSLVFMAMDLGTGTIMNYYACVKYITWIFIVYV